MNRFYPLLLLASLIAIPLLTTAQTHKRKAKQAMNTGRYLHAASHYVEALLGEKKKHKPFKWKCEMAEALIQAEPYTLGRIANLSKLTTTFTGDQTVYNALSIVNSYDSLARLEQRFLALPSEAYATKKCNSLTFSVGNYQADRDLANQRLDSMKQLAAAFHFKNAQEHIASGKLLRQRSAYAELQYTLKFDPDYPEARDLQEKALQAGQRRIMILPFAYRGNGSYQGQGEILRTHVVTEIEGNNTISFWTTFVDPNEAASLLNIERSELANLITEEKAQQLATKLDLHEIYLGQIATITFPKTTTSTEEGSEEHNVVVERRPIPPSEPGGKVTYEDIMGKESFQHKYHIKTVYGKLKGSYRVYSRHTSSWGNTQELNAKTEDAYGWATFQSGSEKAWAKTLMNKKPPKANSLPNFSVRVSEMIQDVAKKMAKFIVTRENVASTPVQVVVKK